MDKTCSMMHDCDRIKDHIDFYRYEQAIALTKDLLAELEQAKAEKEKRDAQQR